MDTRNNKTAIFLALTFVLTLVSTAQQADESWIKLHGQVTAATNQTRLYWDVRKWPEDLRGFTVKRRYYDDKGKPQKWVRLTEEALTPGVREDRNWSLHGLTPKQAREAVRSYVENMGKKRIRKIEEKEALTLLKKENGLKEGDRVRLMRDFNLALIFGFGYIDNDRDAATKADYALFYVRDNKSEKAGAIALFNTARFMTPARPDPDLHFEVSRANEDIKLSWRYAIRNSDSDQVFGFHVYRKAKGGERYEKLLPGAIGRYKRDSQHQWWRFVDKQADVTKDYTYKVAAVDLFQGEFLPTTVEYIAEAFRPLAQPVITGISGTEEQDVRIQWTSDFADRARIQAYSVERAAADGTFFSVSGKLSSRVKAFVDRTPKTSNTSYAYRVVIIDNYGQFYYSALQPIHYVGKAKPPPVTGLRSSFLYEDGKAYIALTWDDKLDSDKLTFGYRFSADTITPHEFYRQASIPIVKSTSYLFRVYKGGRDYGIRVIAVSEEGGKSKHVETSCYVPLFKVPRPSVFQATVLPKGQVQLTWEYPVFADLKGFRVYMNDTLVANEGEVGINVRGWLIPKPQKRDGSHLANFQIQAIGEVAESGRSVARSLILRDRVMAFHEESPAALQAKLIEKEGNQFAHLAWKGPNLEDAGILGYVLYADTSTQGNVMRMGNTPLIRGNEFAYKLPRPDREAYTFRIAAMNKQREIGPYSEVTLNLK